MTGNLLINTYLPYREPSLKLGTLTPNPYALTPTPEKSLNPAPEQAYGLMQARRGCIDSARALFARYPLSLSLSFSLPFSHSLIHTHTLSLSLSHTHSLPPFLSLSLSLPLSPSRSFSSSLPRTARASQGFRRNGKPLRGVKLRIKAIHATCQHCLRRHFSIPVWRKCVGGGGAGVHQLSAFFKVTPPPFQGSGFMGWGVGGRGPGVHRFNEHALCQAAPPPPLSNALQP